MKLKIKKQEKLSNKKLLFNKLQLVTVMLKKFNNQN